ncbi:rab11 family-interacting protein 4B isoform X1 [Lepeophtheirus salmonis]|uniref:rab11 family-interacting protein 4B isoform X1 n=1 Tax=Lepeophtheirus salmonis TaxID=72036 RepID=UPI001AE62620|nr:rab11 family-interacting protein 4B-like isoform X1 [Lepeophtheirus salmonis]
MMNNFSEDQLQTVFQICKPNSQGKISANNLKNMFNKYSGRSTENAEDEPDTLLSYEEFRKLVLQNAVLSSNSTSKRNKDSSPSDSPPSASLNYRSSSNQQEHTSKSFSSQTTTAGLAFDETDSVTHHMSPPSLDLMSNTSLTDNQPLSLTDSAIGSSTSPEAPHKSQCSSLSDRDEENFESFGENVDIEFDNENDVDTLDGRFVRVNSNASPLSDRNLSRRNTWLRTSLRRSPGSNNVDNIVPPRRWGSLRYPNKRVSSNAYASALYNNNVGSSPSGRSSNGDDGDMQSDISLEEDVNDLNQKVQMLQEQVGVLVESQATTDDKYTKVKQDNSSLTTRIHMLEEHIRDLEIKSEERIEDEQKRNKELIVRLEREKTLEIENYTIRLQTLERENSHLQEENSGLRTQVDHLKLEGHNKEELLQEIQTSHTFLQKQYTELEENLRKKQDSFSDKNIENSRLIEELYKETETLKDSLNDRKNDGFIGCGSADSDDDVFGNLASRISEMENEIRSLRDKNGSLQETNEELQAQMLNRGLEEGKILLNGPSDDSLAAEFEAMNENEEEEGQTIGASEYKKIRNALKEQQEVNTSLRRYIDGILMNIMEKYPELLEVRK